MRLPGAAHSVAWIHHKRESQLGPRLVKIKRGKSPDLPQAVFSRCSAARSSINQNKSCVLSRSVQRDNGSGRNRENFGNMGAIVISKTRAIRNGKVLSRRNEFHSEVGLLVKENELGQILLTSYAPNYINVFRRPNGCTFFRPGQKQELNSVNTFACSDVKIQMRPTCVGGVVVTRSPRMSDVRGSNPGTATGYALLMSPNKSGTRVQCFPLVWTHRNNYARTGGRPFKREWQLSPKKIETGRGLSKNFQQPYEQCIRDSQNKGNFNIVVSVIGFVQSETAVLSRQLSPKKIETGRGLSKNFQQPYEQCIRDMKRLYSAGISTQCGLVHTEQQHVVSPKSQCLTVQPDLEPVYMHYCGELDEDSVGGRENQWNAISLFHRKRTEAQIPRSGDLTVDESRRISATWPLDYLVTLKVNPTRNALRTIGLNENFRCT
ncbi:hypothetical protein CLF_102086 [Clonorchis sinensis]|uniref:Uncharacterized protein n=1 Tax=Clonorchis sinensis TaxID=79923 RepID=G7Y794_CLOSI|nr:hypothetical protein CLF_102086 [Clonorchis sinensis]